MSRAVRSWRSRVWIGAGLCAFALGAAGIGWAANGATDANVITACVDPAAPNPALVYSSTGSCGPGQNTVQWDKQGPQGAPGTQGPPGVSATQGVAFGQSTYTNGFTISSTVTARGNYAYEGTISRERTVPFGVKGTFSVVCSILAGPQNGSATVLDSTTQTFVYNRHKKAYVTPMYDSSAGLSVAQFVQTSQVPASVYYTCKKVGPAGRAYFTFPALTLALAQSLHLHVGPALPVRHVVGPGPLSKVGGSG